MQTDFNSADVVAMMFHTTASDHTLLNLIQILFDFPKHITLNTFPVANHQFIEANSANYATIQ